MILKGSQRGGAKQLALHLLKIQDNEHVELHELRGFVAEDLPGALREVHAISQGTRCRQFLFSLSLNPPQQEKVSIEAFEAAIEMAEQRMGLEDQPRAIVFHEKDGRRHAHCVWSRIDGQEMKAINLPHFKLKLRDLSKELYLEHGWTLPKGLVDSKNRDPANYTRAEWQQAKRVKLDPKQLKIMFQECWAISDSKASFANALAERGYHLARGDRRGYVAVDFKGEIYSVSRWTGKKPKELKDRLGDPKTLPSIEATNAIIAARMDENLKRYIVEAERSFQKHAAKLEFKKADLVQRQRA